MCDENLAYVDIHYLGLKYQKDYNLQLQYYLKFDVLELKSPINTILSILDEKVNISSSNSVKAFSEYYFEYSGGIYIQPIKVGLHPGCDSDATLSHRSDNARHR